MVNHRVEHNVPLYLSGAGLLFVLVFVLVTGRGDGRIEATRPAAVAGGQQTTSSGPAVLETVRTTAANAGSGSGSESAQPVATTTVSPSNQASGEGGGPDCDDRYDSARWPTTTVGPVVECPDNPYGAPRRALASAARGWIVVLESIELPDVAIVDGRLDALEASTGTTLILFDSRMYSGLRDPYWVVATGPFATREAAGDFCARRPRLEPCYPRELDP